MSRAFFLLIASLIWSSPAFCADEDLDLEEPTTMEGLSEESDQAASDDLVKVSEEQKMEVPPEPEKNIPAHRGMGRLRAPVSEESDAETVPDNRSDSDWKRIEMMQYHRNLIYAASATAGGKIQIKTMKPSHRALVTAGAFAFGESSGNAIWPYVQVQFATSRAYALGAYAFYQGVGISSVSATQIGGGVSVSFFPMDTFIGVTGTAGIGLGSASYHSPTGTSGSALSFTAFVTAGWRWSLKDDGITIGAQAGAQYTNLPFAFSTGGLLTSASASILVPMFLVDVGFPL